MEGKINKSFTFSTIVKIDDLELLDKYLSSEYKSVKYTIQTSNGGEYDLDDFKELIDYDNPDSRKIISIQIRANKENNKSNNRRFSDLEISIMDGAEFSESISYTIRNATDKEINAYSNKLDELILNFKSPYSWLHTNAIYLIAGLLMAILAIIIGIVNNFKDPIINYIIIYGFFALFLGAILSKIIIYPYPQTIFCIGKQINFSEKRKKIRHTIGIVIFLGFVVSFVASTVVYFITKS